MEKLLKDKTKNAPFTMLWAKENTNSPTSIEGEYDYKKDKWSNIDIYNATTWCRSTTTSDLLVINTDPDEDEDDQSK